MNSNYTGILLGGLLPAVLYGICGICTKASNRQGISLNYFILFAGAGAIFVAFLSFALFKEKSMSTRSATQAFLVGATWAGGLAIVAMALTKYNTPISMIAPLNATACLITILLALWMFAEWKDVHVARLLIGAILIVIGGMLVSASSNTTRVQPLNPPDNQFRAASPLIAGDSYVSTSQGPG
jgi:transporter family protein